MSDDFANYKYTFNSKNICHRIHTTYSAVDCMWAIRIYAHLSLAFAYIVFRFDCLECTLVTQRRRVDNDNGRNAPDFVARTTSHLIKIQFADSSLRQIIDYVIESSLIFIISRSRYYLYLFIVCDYITFYTIKFKQYIITCST